MVYPRTNFRILSSSNSLLVAIKQKYKEKFCTAANFFRILQRAIPQQM
jgi:hypothetical protein